MAGGAPTHTGLAEATVGPAQPCTSRCHIWLAKETTQHSSLAPGEGVWLVCCLLQKVLGPWLLNCRLTQFKRGHHRGPAHRPRGTGAGRRPSQAEVLLSAVLRATSCLATASTPVRGCGEPANLLSSPLGSGLALCLAHGPCPDRRH